MSLPDISPEERLRLFELLNPVYRLLDFWFGHPHQAITSLSTSEWDDSQWEQATVHIHPQLSTIAVEQEMRSSIKQIRPLVISRYLSISEDAYFLDSTITTCLLPLLQSPQTLEALVARYCKLYPFNRITLEPVNEKEAREFLQQALIMLERAGYFTD